MSTTVAHHDDHTEAFAPALAKGSNEILIDAPPSAVWAILEDSTMLSQWMPIVTGTTGTVEARGRDRTCDVTMGRRHGQVRERCVVFDPPRRIGWVLVDDTLGFAKMLSGFAFDFALLAGGAGRTRLINTTYYRPKGLFARLMSALVLKRKFAGVRLDALANLSRMAELDVRAFETTT